MCRGPRDENANIDVNAGPACRCRGRLPHRFRTPARVLMTMHVAPEVEVHPDLSVSRRQPAWIHRTPVSPIVAKTSERNSIRK